MTADPNVIDYGKYLLYRSQVFRNPAMLYHVLEEYKTYEICLAAFVYDEVNALQYVPDHHKTYELCMTAVKCCGTNVYFVPEEHLTNELKAAAMNQNPWIKLEYLVTAKEPIGYNNAEPRDYDISDAEDEEPIRLLPTAEEYDLHTEEDVIHRFERLNRFNMMAAMLA